MGGASNGTATAHDALASIRQTVGIYNYFALAMFLIMQFCVSVGVSSVPYFLLFEVFPFKWVPFLANCEKAQIPRRPQIDFVPFSDLERFIVASLEH